MFLLLTDIVFKRENNSTKKKSSIYDISRFLLTTIVEYITGTILDVFLQKRLWDYSHYAFNINGLICLSASTRFAIGGTIFIYGLQPLFDKLIDFMNIKTRSVLAYGILIIVIIDFIFKII